MIKGAIVLAIDLRGYGETETEAWRFNERHAGPNAAEYFISYMSEKSLVGMRIEDIFTAIRSLGGIRPKKHRINIVASGDAGIPALHAAALIPERFFTITIRDSITTWQSVIEFPVTIRQLENTVHGALQFYDLPDLIELAGPDIVTIESPRDATGKLIPVNDKTK